MDKLIFYEGIEKWSRLPTNPKSGMVGCYGADRAPCWDLFIVKNYDIKTKKITAIFPRMRLINNNIVLGVDKLTEKYKNNFNCICRHPCQGDDFFCHCVADKQNRDYYSNTFIEVDCNYKYSSIEFPIPTGWIFLELLLKNNINELDIPIQNH